MATTTTTSASERRSFVHTLIQQCMACNPAETSSSNSSFFPKNISPSMQFVQLTGIRFIGLGAVVDELSPRERVYDTLEVFRNDPNRLLRIGYVCTTTPNSVATTSSVPLTVWERDDTGEHETAMSVAVQSTVALVRRGDTAGLLKELLRQLRYCRSHSTMANSGVCFYTAGIVAHNVGVAQLLAGEDGTNMFVEAIHLKEAAFGKDHEEVALSWEQRGVQQFALGDMDTARSCFQTAHRLRVNKSSNNSRIQEQNPILGMTLNNIACCDFQVGQYNAALESLEEARQIQHQAVGSSVQDDLDLLHVAVVYGNCGYLNLALKRYETAHTILQEALLIQQSVLLEDNHRSIRDTLSNLEFANAFHS